MVDGECNNDDSSLLSLSLRVGQVSLEELGHAEGADLVLPEDWLHLGVGLEVLLVLGVLELVGLEVSPDPLHNLGSGELLPLLGTDQVGELSAQGQRLRQSGSLQREAVTKLSLFGPAFLGPSFFRSKNGKIFDNKHCQRPKRAFYMNLRLTLGIL